MELAWMEIQALVCACAQVAGVEATVRLALKDISALTASLAHVGFTGRVAAASADLAASATKGG